MVEPTTEDHIRACLDRLENKIDVLSAITKAKAVWDLVFSPMY